MRSLEFVVSGQRIRKNSKCNFSGLVAGSTGYLTAEFTFSQEWYNLKKVACFRTKEGVRSFTPIVNGKCEIDDKIAAATRFYVSVVGTNDNMRLITNEAAVMQQRGK